MSLPKIDLPIYEVPLPSSGKTVRIRPFVVKEEKLLLIAAESKDENEIITVTKQVINNCLIDGDVDVEKLPFFDVDFLFIALRAKSIGEAVEMRFVCNNVIEEDVVCDHSFNANIDISTATFTKDETISANIALNDRIAVKMKYPSYGVLRAISDEDGTMERKIKIMMNSIDFITEGEEVHSSKDYSKDEMRSFIENLTEEQFQKLEKFVANFPSFAVNLDAECGKCKYVHRIEYTDFASFF
jgi:hypothetical protein